LVSRFHLRSQLKERRRQTGDAAGEFWNGEVNEKPNGIDLKRGVTMELGKALILTGAILTVAGLIWIAAARLGLGSLPGDITIDRGNFRLYLPLATGLLISIVLSAIFWLIGRL
jgi:hypothetical protein